MPKIRGVNYCACHIRHKQAGHLAHGASQTKRLTFGLPATAIVAYTPPQWGGADGPLAAVLAKACKSKASCTDYHLALLKENLKHYQLYLCSSFPNPYFV